MSDSLPKPIKRLLLWLLLIASLGVKVNAITLDSLVYGAFGKVFIYRPATEPNAVVLFVSGDGGWNSGVVAMAKDVVAQGALVVGMDVVHYLKRVKDLPSKCFYPASDLEDLSLFIQKKLQYKQYFKPILVGYSSGATLVYGALAQAPANTFKGALTLGFCPDLEIGKPFCKGAGLKCHLLKGGKSIYLEPFAHLTAPFVALQGMIDLVCSAADVKTYLEEVPDSKVVLLPQVGHGFAVTKKWLPQFAEAYQEVLYEPTFAERKAAESKAAEIKLLEQKRLEPLDDDLPLILVPPIEGTEGTPSAADLPLAIFISGDGGWTSFDHAISEKLAEKGMPVVGLDAQKYFWNPRDPQDVSKELENAALHYMQLWNRHSFVLVGYSFGGCVGPFIANDFTPGTKTLLKGVYCISPSETADFEIHISDMLSMGSAEKYDVLKEIMAIKSLNPVCIFGAEEEPEIRDRFSATGAKVEVLPGSHHYDNDFNALANLIVHDFLCDK